MKSAIEKILNGGTESQNIKPTEEHNRLSKKSYEIFEGFYASLTEKQKEQYNKIYDLESGMQVEMENAFYKEGLKLGLFLALEISEE